MLSAAFGVAPPCALVSSGRGGGGHGSLTLGLQRRQRHADLLGGRSQVWLLLPQLGEQRLEAEVGISYAQSTNGLQEGIGRAGFAHATIPEGTAAVGPRSHARATASPTREGGGIGTPQSLETNRTRGRHCGLR